MFLEICMQIHSMAFALSRQINKQKYAKTIKLLGAGNELLVNYQAQGWLLTPTPLRTPLALTIGIWGSLAFGGGQNFRFSLIFTPL